MTRAKHIALIAGALAALTGLAGLAGATVLRHDAASPATASASAPVAQAGSGAASGEGAGTNRVSCAASGREPELSVLTFNIHGARSDSGYHLGRIAGEIRRWDPDVVLLQEVDRHRPRTRLDDQPQRLADRLGMQAVFGHNVVHGPLTQDGDPRQYGTAVLTRLPVTDWHNEHLPNQPGLERRGLLHVTVRLGNQLVSIYNTHLQHTAGNIRLVQMRAIRDVVERDPLPHVLAGDLNATPDSRALRIASRFLTDSWPAVGVGDGLTVPARVPHRRIDYILHDDNWTPTSATTMLSAVSDHRALRVDLRLTPTACS